MGLGVYDRDGPNTLVDHRVPRVDADVRALHTLDQYLIHPVGSLRVVSELPGALLSLRGPRSTGGGELGGEGEVRVGIGSSFPFS